jgi:hypothetical protein
VGLRLRLEEACLAEGFSPRVRYESRSLRPFAAEGLGVAIVPRCMAEGEGPAVAAVGLGSPPLVRTVATFRIARRQGSRGDIGVITVPKVTGASFCLLFEGVVPVFIYVRLVPRRAGVRMMTESERRR